MAKAKTSGPRLYEGLFLLNQGAVASDFAGVIEHVKELFTRAKAELLVLTKWDERRLAYEIKGQKRGLFLLAYFRAEGDAVAHIENDVNLSERVVRVMMIRADHVGETELEMARKEADLSLEAKLRDGSDESKSPSADKRKPVAVGANDAGDKNDTAKN